NARRSRDLRGRHAKLERCHHQALLLLTRPAAPSLDRRDHLHSRHRHRATPRIVPRTSDVRPQTARRPSPEGYAVAAAANKLSELRENWLNPPDLVTQVPEVVPGYPDRMVPIDELAAEKLKTRTLTNLYNERPAWLLHAHKALDEAVAAAYGWPADLPDDEVLARLFELNQQRAAKQ